MGMRDSSYGSSHNCNIIHDTKLKPNVKLCITFRRYQYMLPLYSMQNGFHVLEFKVTIRVNNYSHKTNYIS